MMEFNQLYHADCRQMLKELPSESIDFIVTDPPYGTTDATFDKIDFPHPEEYMNELMRVIKPNGAVCIFSQLPFSCDVIKVARKWYRYEWIWEKDLAVGFLNAHKMPMRCHENILVFYKHLPTYNPQKWQGKPGSRDIKKRLIGEHGDSCYKKTVQPYSWKSTDGLRYPRDVVKFVQAAAEFTPNDTSFRKSLHPTQKPRRLYEYLIKTYSNENEVVLDAFAGSGTCAVACKNTRRRYICIEKDEKYYKIAIERIEKGETDDGTNRDQSREITLWT